MFPRSTITADLLTKLPMPHDGESSSGEIKGQIFNPIVKTTKKHKSV